MQLQWSKTVLAIIVLTVGLIAIACTQGTTITRNTLGNQLESSISRNDIEPIERYLLKRFPNLHSPSVNLKHEIREEIAQNAHKGITPYYDESYWLLWAEQRFFRR
jgi:hypothetical protein